MYFPIVSTFRYPATLNHSKWMYDRSSLKCSKPVSDLVVPLFLKILYSCVSFSLRILICITMKGT